MEAVKELQLARSVAKARCRGIGEPVVRLNPKHVGVNPEDTSMIWMTITDLTELVRSVLEENSVGGEKVRITQREFIDATGGPE